jgi:hypothetical protein
MRKRLYEHGGWNKPFFDVTKRKYTCDALLLAARPLQGLPPPVMNAEPGGGTNRSNRMNSLPTGVFSTTLEEVRGKTPR